MGTFHDDKGDLHGITVVAETDDTVYVGRCDTIDASEVILLDCDLHREGEDDKTNAEWLQHAARFGVWKKHDRLAVSVTDVKSVTPLGDFVRQGATRPVPPPATVMPSIMPAPAEALVTVTDAAQAEVRRLMATEDHGDQGLRLGVSGGGCSGFVYKVEFDTRREGDLVVPCRGFDAYLDRKSTIYLRGVVLDHQAGLGGRGFVFNNPNASNTCGCGESFAV